MRSVGSEPPPSFQGPSGSGSSHLATRGIGCVWFATEVQRVRRGHQRRTTGDGASRGEGPSGKAARGGHTVPTRSIRSGEGIGYGSFRPVDQACGSCKRTRRPRPAEATGKQKADLEQDVKEARDSAQAQADSFASTPRSERTSSRRGGTSCSGSGTSRWRRSAARSRRTGAHTTQRRRSAPPSRRTKTRSSPSISRIAAIEEAEYAVLDAQLADVKADELANG